MSRTTILCVGIGGYANLYLESLLNCKESDFEIVGLVDISKEYCKFAEQLSDTPFYNCIEDFYKEHTADLCIITTPIHLHTRQILCALENGSNVMCEKPLSGCSDDEKIISEKARAVGKFVMIGYQWSYSKAINILKEDILNGVYGEPEFLKTLVLWPRDTDYFKRGSGWAGKLNAADGTPINDSIVNNAAAHYLHNILYVTGRGYGQSSEVTEVEADLLRTNDIENFDTAVIRFKLDNGADGMFVASHSTRITVDPCFEYRFSYGTVEYNDETKMIVGRTKDGIVREYGNPFKDVNEKIYEAISACAVKDYVPCCSAKTASAHVRCVEKVQKHRTYDVNKAYVKQNGKFLYIDGLDDMMLKCYRDEKMLSDMPEYEELVKE